MCMSNMMKHAVVIAFARLQPTRVRWMEMMIKFDKHEHYFIYFNILPVPHLM